MAKRKKQRELPVPDLGFAPLSTQSSSMARRDFLQSSTERIVLPGTVTALIVHDVTSAPGEPHFGISTEIETQNKTEPPVLEPSAAAVTATTSGDTPVPTRNADVTTTSGLVHELLTRYFSEVLNWPALIISAATVAIFYVLIQDNSSHLLNSVSGIIWFVLKSLLIVSVGSIFLAVSFCFAARKWPWWGRLLAGIGSLLVAALAGGLAAGGLYQPVEKVDLLARLAA